MEEAETRRSRDARGGARLRESQHAVKGMKGEEMGDDIVEMTVWGEGAEESGKTGCTGYMKHVVDISSGSHAGDLPPFRIGYKDLLFHKSPLPPDENRERSPQATNS